MFRTLITLAPFLCIALTSATRTAQPSVSFVSRPLRFEANQGQSDSAAQFISYSSGSLVQIGNDGLSFQLSENEVGKLQLLNIQNQATPKGTGPLSGNANYFSGSDQSRWHANVPTYERVLEREVYPGIDVAYYGNESRLEFDFVLQPRAEIDQIQFRLDGAAESFLNQYGDLVIKIGSKSLTLGKPVVYQFALDGVTRQAVPGTYRLDHKSNVLSFVVGPYDRDRSLVIDPVLQYSEYLSNPVVCMAVDAGGNSYVVTNVSPYPDQTMVMKLSPTGTVLYSTSIGSGLSANAIAIDQSGRAFIAGIANGAATLAVRSNAYSSTVPQNQGVFFALLSADGASIPYATYMGGSQDLSTNQANGIAVGPNGIAYLAGSTTSTSFPTTPGAYQTSNPPNLSAGFIAKINPNLSGSASLVYSTLMGSPVQNYGQPGTTLSSIAVDGQGEAYVSGSSAFGYPVTAGAFQDVSSSTAEGGAYVTKLNQSGSDLIYSAYLGPGSATALAVDGQANAYVTGTVLYAGFPVTAGAYQTEYAGGFVTKLDAMGSSEVFSTFLGGPSSGLYLASVIPTSLALTPGCPQQSPAVGCNIYVTGYTDLTDFPAVNPIQAQAASGLPSAFVVELASTGRSAVLSSYLGGTAPLLPYAGPFIGVDSAGTLFLSGNLNEALAGDFPVTVQGPTGSVSFLAKIAPGSASELLASTSSLTLSSPIGIPSGVSGKPSIVNFSNYGSAPINISGIQASSSVFSESNNCGSTIPGGGSCDLTVNFTPSSAGTVNGTIVIKSNATNGNQSLVLTGIGQNSGYLQASATQLIFDAQTVGTSSTSSVITLTNIGSVAIAPAFNLSPRPTFAEMSNCPTRLSSQASCTVQVTFLPSQVGLYTGRLILYDSLSTEALSVSIEGTGALQNVKSAIGIAPSALQFAPVEVGSFSTTAQLQSVVITNTSIEPISVDEIKVTGDFAINYSSCPNLPSQLVPLASCQLTVEFAPNAVGARLGALTIGNSVSTTPTTVSLGGTGLASSEKLEIYPSTAISIPDQPVGSAGPDEFITLQNTGTNPIRVYRVVITGDFRIDLDSCSSSTIPGTADDGIGAYSTCQVSVNFVPSATGLRTGTISVLDDSPGSPHIVKLSGTGIIATGALIVSDTSLTFPPQLVGTVGSPIPEGSVQGFTLYNPGNSPIQVSSIVVTGDFVLAGGQGSCSTPPFTISPGEPGCSEAIIFSPTAVGTRTGTLVIHSSAGTQSGSLTGTATAVLPAALQIEPATSMDFGSLVVGQSGSSQTVYIYNTGSSQVTATSFVISGASANDFTVSPSASECGGTICQQLQLTFTPLGAGARTAKLTLTDSAGIQSLALTGQGLASAPAASVFPKFLTYPELTQGTGSLNSSQQIAFNNNGTGSIMLGNVVVTGSAFLKLKGDSCSANVIPSLATCVVAVEYAPPVASPPANAINSGLVTFKDSAGNTLARVGLSGYSLIPIQSAQLTQTVANFGQYQAIGTSTNLQTGVTVGLLNTGTTPFTLGALSGTNLAPGVPTGAFSIGNTANTLDNCSNSTVDPTSYCTVIVSFSPSAVGVANGTVNFPVTYANNTKGTLMLKLGASGVAEKNSSYLSAASVLFSDTGVGNTSPPTTIVLNNTGNAAITVGNLSGINTIVGTLVKGEFSAKSNDSCSNTTIGAGASCSVNVTFSPTATGMRTGSITFPVTYLDHSIANLTASFVGAAVTAVSSLTIYPQNVVFPDAVQGTSISHQESVIITNTGNTPVTFGTNSISHNAAEFGILYDSCAGTTLSAGANCSMNFLFSPAATSTGNRLGTLNLVDNATGSPKTIALSGTAITPSQEIQLSQTALTFGSQKDGSTSASQDIWITATGPVGSISSVVLSGANTSDFQIYNNCGLFVYGSCSITAVFAPQAGATGTRTASIVETDTAPGSPQTIKLTGVAAP